MQTPERAPDDDSFDDVLRELAQPPELGAKFGRGLDNLSTHPLQDQLREGVIDGREPRPGDVLDGRYRVSSVLGRGGMGVVLEAEHLRAHKSVAIKWMSSRGGSERTSAQIARFLREARAVANIQHPNVVDLYDVGDNQGTPFLVLERLSGESLRTRLLRGPLRWEELEPIIMGVLRGVGAVHRAGIVHRDLKPDNIFLARDAESLVPKVLDFGVAAMRATSEDGMNSLTNTGAVLGTPSYMALEQLTGGEVDARADIYALAVVMYEALTGRLPFEARSAPELAVLVATREAAPPSRWVSGLDRRLEAVLMRALSRDAKGRHPDVGELMRELESLRLPRSWKRSPSVWAGVALMGVLGAGVLWHIDARERTARAPDMSRPPASETPRATETTFMLPAPVAASAQQSVDAAAPGLSDSSVVAPAKRTRSSTTKAPSHDAQEASLEGAPAANTPAPDGARRDVTKINFDDF